MTPVQREEANAEAARRLCASTPVLTDVRPAGEVVPGMEANTILTAGAPMEWADYTGGQRRAVIYGAIYEGLAATEEEADAKLAAGEIVLGTCHAHGCVGSVAGIYTASMPVLVVENTEFGNTGFCNLYEGASHRRLNYGVYDDDVRDGLKFLEDTVAPVLADALRHSGGIPLKPLMRRAVHMGDELHSRNTAGTTLLIKELTPHLVELALSGDADAARLRDTIAFLAENDYFFLRVGMAAAKATADASHGVEGSSVVSGMTLSCKEFAIRVSGLGDEWFRGPLPDVQAKLFPPYTEDDIEWIGGESMITETIGLGGFAQAAAFALQAYQGGSPQAMAETNSKMYDITVAEHSDFGIPFFGYRGTPVGIDLHKVIDTKILPVIDGGLAGRGGGQIGAGLLTAPLECFETALAAWNERVGDLVAEPLG